MSYEIRFPAPSATGRGRYMIDGATRLESFTLREIDGTDEEYAVTRARETGSNIAEEMIRISVVAVNDAPVSQPYLQMGKWNARARSLLATAWREMNAVSDREEAAFLSGALGSGEDDPSAK